MARVYLVNNKNPDAPRGDRYRDACATCLALVESQLTKLREKIEIDRSMGWLYESMQNDNPMTCVRCGNVLTAND